jgi:hypothetical protein
MSGYLIKTSANKTNTQKQDAAIVNIFFFFGSAINPHKFFITLSVNGFDASGFPFTGAEFTGAAGVELTGVSEGIALRSNVGASLSATGATC